MRETFFFDKFQSNLKTVDRLFVFAAKQAKVPQLKIVIDDELIADLSIAFVDNSQFKLEYILLGQSVVKQLNPVDTIS